MRRDLAVVGAALVLGGAALVVRPDLDVVPAGVVTPTALAVLGFVVALVGAAVTVEPRTSGGESSIAGGKQSSAGKPSTRVGEPSTRVGEPSNPDGEPSPPIDGDRLGAEFDATLARVETMSSAELRYDDAPAELRAALREAAVDLVATRAGVDREAAAARVERGEWTDDPLAAAFLSDSLRVPPGVRLRERVSTTPRVVVRARRTADALEGEL